MNIGGRNALVSRFRLAGFEERDGRKLARVTGSVPKGWGKVVPEIELETLYDVERGLPVESRHSYASKSRRQTITTTARWAKKPAQATEASTSEAAKGSTR